jgi:DNA-binding SARP family transcriptional activator/tetratricopeptide (TPR) repeat protein
MARSEQLRWPRIELRSLGDCAVHAGDRRIDPRAHVTFAALLHLVIEAGKTLPRSHIQSLLWPYARPVEARHRLRQTIYELKRIGIELVADDRNVTLVADGVLVDFRDAIANCQQDCRALFKDFLPDYTPRISPAFEDWLEALRTQVNLQIRGALLTSIGIQRSNGHWANVEATARRCLAIDPLNEEATLALAEAMAMGGNKLEAVRLLDHYVAELDLHAPTLVLPTRLLRQRISDRLLPVQSPLIGRDSEIAPITAMIRRTQREEGGCYLIMGDAGVGKTRIMREIRRVATLEGVSVLATECLPSDTECPLSVLTRLISAIQKLPGALGCSPSSLRHLAKLTDEGCDLSRSPCDLDSATSIYSSIKGAIVELVAAVAHEVRLLLVIDDFDHSDKWSADIVADLIAASRSQPLVILVSARSATGSVAKLIAANRGLRLHNLKPLSRSDSRTLIQSLTSASHGGVSSDLQDLYVEMSEGNPLSIHELAHYWENCGHLAPIPPSIEETLQRRVSDLDGRASNLLQAIVLLGQNATTDRLVRLLGMSRSEVLSELEILERARIVRWESGALSCTHNRLAELVRVRLSSTASISLHGRIANLLRSELEPPHNSRILWDCAYHYYSAGSQLEGIDLLSRCSDRLLKVGLPHEAVSVWEQALNMCRTDEERVVTQEKLITALRALGDLSRISNAAAEVLRLRRALQLQSPVWADWQIDVLEAKMYALENVEPILVEASACLVDESTAPDTRVRAGICAMICACNLQDPGRLTRIHDLLLSLATTIPFQETDRLIVELIYHTELGNLEEGAAAGRDLVALARRTGSPSFLAQSLRRHARALRLLGNFGDALAALNEAMQLAQWMGSRSYVLRARSHIALALIEQGDLRAARDLLSRGMTREDRRCFPYRVIEMAQLRAMLALIEGNELEAKRVCDSRLFSNWRIRSSRSSGRIMYYSLAVSALFWIPREVTSHWRKQTLRLEREFLRLQDSGEQDFIALALCKSLLAQGQNSHARAILTDYVEKHRRERYPVPKYLRDLLKHEHVPQVSISSGAMVAPGRE